MTQTYQDPARKEWVKTTQKDYAKHHKIHPRHQIPIDGRTIMLLIILSISLIATIKALLL